MIRSTTGEAEFPRRWQAMSIPAGPTLHAFSSMVEALNPFTTSDMRIPPLSLLRADSASGSCGRGIFASFVDTSRRQTNNLVLFSMV